MKQLQNISSTSDLIVLQLSFRDLLCAMGFEWCIAQAISRLLNCFRFERCSQFSMHDSGGPSKAYVQTSPCGQQLSRKQEHVGCGFSSESPCLEDHVSALYKFASNKRSVCKSFPSTLTSTDRARLHELCPKLKLDSMSCCQGLHTVMKVWKQEPTLKPPVVSCASANILAVAAMKDEAKAYEGFGVGVVVYNNHRVLVVTCHDETSFLASVAHDMLPCRTEDVQIVELEWHELFQAFTSHGRIKAEGKYYGLQVFGIGGHVRKRIRACRIGLAICALWNGFFLERKKHEVLRPLMDIALAAYMAQPSATLWSTCVQETGGNVVSHSLSAASAHNIHDQTISNFAGKKTFAIAAVNVPLLSLPAPLPMAPRVIMHRCPPSKRCKTWNGIVDENDL